MTSTPLWLPLFAAKIVVSAGIVIGVTAAVERLGPRLGGLVAATPQLSVVALIFFCLEQGPDFAGESAFWNIPGSCASITMLFGYLLGAMAAPRSRVAAIATGGLVGITTFCLTTAVLGAVGFSRAAVMPFAAAVCFAVAWAARRLPDSAPLARVRSSPALLAARAGISAAMVIGLTSIAHLLGPKWSGLIAGFPVNSLPVVAIIHFHYGVETIKPVLKVWPAGLFGICLFNLTAWLTIGRLGLVGAVVLGYAVDLLWLVALYGRRPLVPARR